MRFRSPSSPLLMASGVRRPRGFSGRRAPPLPPPQVPTSTPSTSSFARGRDCRILEAGSDPGRGREVVDSFPTQNGGVALCERARRPLVRAPPPAWSATVAAGAHGSRLASRVSFSFSTPAATAARRLQNLVLGGAAPTSVGFHPARACRRLSLRGPPQRAELRHVHRALFGEDLQAKCHAERQRARLPRVVAHAKGQRTFRERSPYSRPAAIRATNGCSVIFSPSRGRHRRVFLSKWPHLV